MRALTVGLMVLGLMGIALVGVTSPATSVNKVVIGVLDFETSGPAVKSPEEKKEGLGKKEVAVSQEVKEITKEEVRQFFANYVKQYTQRDIDGFLSLFSPEALQNGRDGFDEIKKIYSDFFVNSQELRYHIDDMRMRIYQHTVHVIARYKVDQILKKEAKRGTWRGDIRWILGRENGDLKIRYLDYRHYWPQKSR